MDVRGDALSLVIIDKLHFTAPDEPLLKARIEDCRLQGGDPFNDIQIPEAVDRKSTRLNSSHITRSRMPSSA